MKHPPYTTQTLFRNLVNQAYTFYVTEGRKPIAADLAPITRKQLTTEPDNQLVQYPAAVAAFDITSVAGPTHANNVTTLMRQQADNKANEHHALVQKIMQSPEWAEAMGSRGIPWRDTDSLSSEQYYALALLNDPTDRRSLSAKLAALRIPYGTYRAWMRDPKFARAVRNLSEQMLQDAQGQAHIALVKQLEKGDINAIKYYNELTGRHDPNQKQVLDMMSILGQVIEIIQQHVKDSVALEGIARDISILTLPLQQANNGGVISAEYSEAGGS